MGLPKLMGTKGAIFYLTSEFPPGPGGIGVHGFHLTAELARRGYVVKVFAPLRKEFAHSPINDVNVDMHYHSLDNGHLKRYLSQTHRLAEAIRKTTTPKMIVASGGISSWIASWLKWWFRIPAMAIAHGMDINPSLWWKRLIVRHALRSVDHVVAVSNYTADRVRYLVPRKVTVINNGIDRACILNLAQKVPPINLRGHPALVTVGSISERKGQLNVVNALPLIRRHFPEVHYHMVGVPYQADKVRKRAEELGVSDHITIYGVLSEEDKMAILKASDIFVMLSQCTRSGDFEGFGIAILEANVVGKPAIGTRQSGIADAIDDGHSGWLVDPHQPSQILQAIQDIMKHYTRYAEAVRRHAARFDWKNISDQYEAIIHQLMHP